MAKEKKNYPNLRGRKRAAGEVHKPEHVRSQKRCDFGGRTVGGGVKNQSMSVQNAKKWPFTPEHCRSRRSIAVHLI